MRHDAQFDLRVIGGYQRAARGRYERLPNAPSIFGSNRYVLQIRSRRGESAGGGDRLMIRGMNASRGRIDLLGEIVRVGRLELGDTPVFQYQLGQGIGRGELFENVLRRRWLAGGSLARHRDAQLAE